MEQDRREYLERDRKERDVTNVLLELMQDNGQLILTDRFGNLWQCRIVKSQRKYA